MPAGAGNATEMNTRTLAISLSIVLMLTLGWGISLPSAGAGDRARDGSCSTDESGLGQTVAQTVEQAVTQTVAGWNENTGQQSVPATTPTGPPPNQLDQTAATTEASQAPAPEPSPEQPTPPTTTAAAPTPQPSADCPSASGPDAQRAADSAWDEDVGARRDRKSARRQDGAPTPQTPGFSYSVPGPARIGVPNFFIDKFRIPPFLLPIYQAAGSEYGVPWQVLAAINEIETDYGRNLNVSSAGAVGWMQFLPSSWKAYGLDANNDGLEDPYNPVDAIFAAARYLRAAGADEDLRRAIFAYNHADWYVESVMLRAKLIGGLPDELVGALSGLTEGRFPVDARATYADSSSPDRRAIDIYSRPGSAVVAVNDGVITRVGRDSRLGRFVELRDVYGNRYTYSQLGTVARSYPAPKRRPVAAADRGERKLPADPRPRTAASAGRQPRTLRKPGRDALRAKLLSARPAAGHKSFEAYLEQAMGIDRKDIERRSLKPGALVMAGTVLGRIARTDGDRAAHVNFAIRPAGDDSPAIDPKPILDGWKLLESTALYRVAGKNPFVGPDARHPTGGQMLLLGKDSLERRVLADPRIEIYECGRRDIQAGRIDRRVLAAIGFLAASGLRPTITSLTCGHSYYTKAGSVSHHTSGNAVDIAAVNGMPILGHQGPGSITELTIRRLLTLQGAMRPDQIISLMKFEGASNTVAMADHADHIHIGFQPPFALGGKLGHSVVAVLKPDQWSRLTNRINALYSPDRRAKRASAEPAVSPALPQLENASPEQARDIALELAAEAEAPTNGPAQGEPAIEVKPLIAEPGDQLVVKGSGWSCEEAQDKLEVTITLGEDGEELGEAKPDEDGKFKVEVKLARDLLPDDLQVPTPFVIFAEAECEDGEDLSTGSSSPAILVVENAPPDDGGGSNDGDRDRGDSNDGDGGDDGDDGDETEEPEPAELVAEPEDIEPGPEDEDADEDQQEVLGASDESDDDGDSDRDRKDRGGAGDDDGKDKQVSVPRKVPRLLSAAEAIRSPALTGWPPPKFPQPAPWYLIAGIVLILVGMALLAMPAVARFGGALLAGPERPEAPTAEMPRVTPPGA